jgi:hypothetical protein
MNSADAKSMPAGLFSTSARKRTTEAVARATGKRHCMQCMGTRPAEGFGQKITANGRTRHVCAQCLAGKTKYK